MNFRLGFVLALFALAFADDAKKPAVLPIGLFYGGRLSFSLGPKPITLKGVEPKLARLAGDKFYTYDVKNGENNVKTIEIKTAADGKVAYTYELTTAHDIEIAIITDASVVVREVIPVDQGQTQYLFKRLRIQADGDQKRTIADQIGQQETRRHITFVPSGNLYVIDDGDFKAATIIHILPDQGAADITRNVVAHVPFSKVILISADGQKMYRLGYDSKYFTQQDFDLNTETEYKISATKFMQTQYITDNVPTLIKEGKLSVDQKTELGVAVTARFAFITESFSCQYQGAALEKGKPTFVACADEFGFKIYDLDATGLDNVGADRVIFTPTSGEFDTVITEGGAPVYIVEKKENDYNYFGAVVAKVLYSLKGKKLISGNQKISASVSPKLTPKEAPLLETVNGFQMVQTKAKTMMMKIESIVPAEGCAAGENKYRLHAGEFTAKDLAVKQYDLCTKDTLMFGEHQIAYAADHVLVVRQTGEKFSVVKFPAADKPELKEVLKDLNVAPALGLYLPVNQFLFYQIDVADIRFVNLAKPEVDKVVDIEHFAKAISVSDMIQFYITSDVSTVTHGLPPTHKVFTDKDLKFSAVKDYREVIINNVDQKAVSAFNVAISMIAPDVIGGKGTPTIIDGLSPVGVSTPRNHFSTGVVTTTILPHQYFLGDIDSNSIPNQYSLIEISADSLIPFFNSAKKEQTTHAIRYSLPVEIGAEPRALAYYLTPGQKDVVAQLYTQEVVGGSNVALIVIIAIVVVLLLAGLGFGAFFMIKRRKQMASTPLLSKATDEA